MGKMVDLEDYPQQSPVKDGAKGQGQYVLFENQLLCFKVVDPDLLPDKTHQ